MRDLPAKVQSRAEIMNFSNSVAIISGAGSGLGRVFAEFLAVRGAKVVINSNSSSCLVVAKCITQKGGIALAIPGDISDRNFCMQIVEQTILKFGKIDILINCAGNRPDTEISFPDISEDEVMRVFGVHVLGTFHLIAAAWKFMRERRYGRIIVSSSSRVFGTEPGFSYGLPHSIAKSAILGLVKGLAADGEECGIRINAIMPISLSDSKSSSPLLRKILAAINSDENIVSERLAYTVAFLVHQNFPYNGQVFSLCNGRIARVFFGESCGFRIETLNLREISDNFHRAMTTDSYFIPDAKSDMEHGIGLKLSTLK